MARLSLNKWESTLIALFGALFCSSLTLYVQKFPLRYYLFELSEEGVRSQVGVVKSKQGIVTREILGESGFAPLETTSALYNEDTVVSGPDSSMTVELDDGGTIDLGPNTMIKLSFETDISFEGITRAAKAAKVKVITGDVTGQSKGRKIVVAARDQQVKLTRSNVQPMKIVVPRMPVVPVSINAAPVKPAPITITPVQEVARKAEPAPTAAPVAIAPPITVPKPEIKAEPKPIAKAVVKPIAPPPQKIEKPAIPSLRARLLSPAPNALFSIPGGSKSASIKLPIQFELSPANSQAIAVLKRLGPNPQLVMNQKLQATGTLARAEIQLLSPGSYEVEIQEVPESKTAAPLRVLASRFAVKPEFQGIEIMDTLVGGQKMTSNQLQGKRLENFDITFQWKPFPGASRYRIWLASAPNATKPLLEREVAQPSFVLNKGRIFNGKIYYKITALADSGFRPSSDTELFSFEYLPPRLVTPKDMVTLKKDPETGGIAIMTWQKTNFTNSYELEIAKDAKFTQVVTKAKTADNFRVMQLPPPGTYWWRVRGYSGNTPSPNSVSNRFVVK